jgi:alpha-D-xyloside xylohydrolase
VFTESGEVDFYLPEGTWTHLLSGEKKAGGRWHHEQHGFMSLPLYVAPNTVLPWGDQTERPDYDYARGTTLRVFELADGASAPFVVVSPQGRVAARGTVGRQGTRYTATVSEGALQQWCLDVDGRRSPVAQDGAATLTFDAR